MELLHHMASPSSQHGEGRYIGGTYHKRNPTWHVEDSPWKAEQVLNIISNANLSPKTICEVGCGAGEVLVQMAKGLPADVMLTGYEISPHAFEMCQSRESENIHFILGDIVEDEAAHFDLLVLLDVVEHVEDYRGFLDSMRSKADHVILNIPMDFNVYASLRHTSLERSRKALGHIHHFNRSTALDTLRDAGFDILEDRYIHPWSDPRMRRADSTRSRLLRTARRVAWSISPELSVKVLGAASLLVLAQAAP